MEEKRNENEMKKIEDIKYEMEIVKDEYYEICDEINNEVRNEVAKILKNVENETEEMKSVKNRYYKLGKAAGIIETLNRIKSVIEK